MIFSFVNDVFTVRLDLISTTTLAGILLVLGYFLRRKVSVLEKFCIPAPVIGGFLFAFFTLFGKLSGTFTFSLDTTLQTPFMLAFFTTIGLGGSLALIKKGGRALIIYLVICWALAFIQNAFGVSMATLLGLEPVLGVMAGAVSLEGGHGAAATFGIEVEKMGYAGAQVVALSSATFGLIAGSLTGGPLARFLIDRRKIKIETQDMDIDYDDIVKAEQENETINSKEFLFSMTLIGIMMVIGVAVSKWVAGMKLGNFFLPGYVGAMFGAILIRNLNDKYKVIKINTKIISLVSDISIGFFLTMAMMSLKIWELADLALPLIIILVLQVLIVLALSVFVLFPMLGKDYDAAVMCAGMMGHGLGATPNAVANMGSVCEHYKLRSTKAFLIVPLCGAVLIDLVGIPCITLFISIFT